MEPGMMPAMFSKLVGMQANLVGYRMGGAFRDAS